MKKLSNSFTYSPKLPAIAINTFAYFEGIRSLLAIAQALIRQ